MQYKKYLQIKIVILIVFETENILVIHFSIYYKSICKLLNGKMKTSILQSSKYARDEIWSINLVKCKMSAIQTIYTLYSARTRSKYANLFNSDILKNASNSRNFNYYWTDFNGSLGSAIVKISA